MKTHEKAIVQSKSPMSILAKFSSAISALFAVKQRSGLDPASWLRRDDFQDGEVARLLSPYSQSAWVYIAISVLAENVAQIPFRISRVPGSARKELSAEAQRSQGAETF